jgi:hypothetical protein
LGIRFEPYWLRFIFGFSGNCGFFNNGLNGFEDSTKLNRPPLTED